MRRTRQDERDRQDRTDILPFPLIPSSDAVLHSWPREDVVSEAAAWRIVSRAILFTFAVLILIWLLVQVAPVIVKLLLAVILAAGMKPLVDRLTARERFVQGRWRPTRGLVVLAVYVVTIVLVVVASGLILRVVISEVTNLINVVTVYAPRIVAQVDALRDLLPGGRQMVAEFDIAGQLSGLVDRLFGVFSQALVVFQYVLGLLGGLLDVLMILLMALYITTAGPSIGHYLRAFLPAARHEQAARVTSRIFQRLGGWV